MSEPLADRLKRFTPDGTTLDRDALLFNAGRASVRPNRGWMGVAAGLAACQLLTLGLLWPSRTMNPTVVTHPAPAVGEQAPSPPTQGASEAGVLNPLTSRSPDADLPPSLPSGPLEPDAPPLHAFAVRTDLLPD